MYYPCSENKDADQLRGYREADLRLCFRPCKLLVFSRTGSLIFMICEITLPHCYMTRLGTVHHYLIQDLSPIWHISEDRSACILLRYRPTLVGFG